MWQGRNVKAVLGKQGFDAYDLFGHVAAMCIRLLKFTLIGLSLAKRIEL